MRKPLILGSIIVHAAAFTGLAIAAMWHVDKLPLEDHGTVVELPSVHVDTGGGAAPKPQPMIARVEKPKVRPKDTVQPEKPKDKQEITDAPATDVIGTSTDGKLGNGTGGDGLGKATPTGNGCAIEPCKKDEPPPIIPVKTEEKPKKKTTVLIPESDATRISGESRIEAPSSVKVLMQRADQHKVVGTVKLCVDTGGRVTRASVAKSTGYDDYDDKLTSEMSDWRYSPLVRDGEKTAFCTYITLVYLMR